MSEHQASLFDVLDAPPATDPNVRSGDKKRLSGQNRKILDLLRRGPATGRELAAISMKYTSRVSDLRKAGCEIECQQRAGGNSLYTLTHAPHGL